MNERLAAGSAVLMTSGTLLSFVARLWPARLRPWPRARYATAQFVPLDDLLGARWLPCHNTVCAHLTTRHYRQADGRYACTGCGTTTIEGETRV